jgi:hypothetical protein
MKKVRVIIEKTSTGYSAYAEKLHIYTTGGNVNELLANILEAVNFYLMEKKQNRPD